MVFGSVDGKHCFKLGGVLMGSPEWSVLRRSRWWQQRSSRPLSLNSSLMPGWVYLGAKRCVTEEGIERLGFWKSEGGDFPGRWSRLGRWLQRWNPNLKSKFVSLFQAHCPVSCWKWHPWRGAGLWALDEEQYCEALLPVGTAARQGGVLGAVCLLPPSPGAGLPCWSPVTFFLLPIVMLFLFLSLSWFPVYFTRIWSDYGNSYMKKKYNWDKI